VSGFEFHETMSGSFRLRGEDRDRPMSFTVRARSRRWIAFLEKREVEIEGEVDAVGFADHRRLRGTLGLDTVITRKMPYAFHFTGNDGKAYTFAGEKTIHLASLVESMTVLPGAIRDADGAEVAEALLRFDLRGDLVRFLGSWRLAH
jgi:hypothetical protein